MGKTIVFLMFFFNVLQCFFRLQPLLITISYVFFRCNHRKDFFTIISDSCNICCKRSSSTILRPGLGCSHMTSASKERGGGQKMLTFSDLGGWAGSAIYDFCRLTWFFAQFFCFRWLLPELCLGNLHLRAYFIFVWLHSASEFFNF